LSRYAIYKYCLIAGAREEHTVDVEVIRTFSVKVYTFKRLVEDLLGLVKPGENQVSHAAATEATATSTLSALLHSFSELVS
jgi:hypothetical protein